jgi:uncharacterized protein (TIGR00255 family)
MLKSMTGYGKSVCELPNKKLSVEIKSLNSKQSDTNTRLPSIYRQKDLEIRNLLSTRLSRGKIELSIHYEMIQGTASSINEAVVRDYFRQISAIAFELGIKDHDQILPAVMRLPDTVVAEKEEPDQTEWAQVLSSIEQAIDEVDMFRKQEGEALYAFLKERVLTIREKLSMVQPFEEERMKRVKDRLRSGLDDLRGKEETDPNRFEQELIYYIEKLDISEEKARLDNHCRYFLEVMDHDSPNGKKLGFISQEMGREINTLGSKANHSDIQRLVVEMKDELEQIKEQTLNVL